MLLNMIIQNSKMLNLFRRILKKLTIYFAGFNAVIWATYGIKKFIRTISQNKIRGETQPINEN